MASIAKQATLDFESKKTLSRVTRGIQSALAESLVRWPMRHSTQSELKRRFTLLFEGYRVLRNEESYSVTRAIDNLLNILQADLDKDQSALRSHSRTSWFAGS